MNPGVIDRALLRRHLFALDHALTRLEPRAQLSIDAYLADAELQWAVELAKIRNHVCRSRHRAQLCDERLDLRDLLRSQFEIRHDALRPGSLPRCR